MPRLDLELVLTYAACLEPHPLACAYTAAGTNWPMHPEIHRLRQLGLPRDASVYNSLRPPPGYVAGRHSRCLNPKP